MIKKIFSLKFLFYLLLVNIVTILFIYSQKDFLQYSSIYSKKYSDIKYDSKSKDKRLSSYKEFTETKRSDLKDVEISFDATIYSISKYDNIFQTAPVNEGIRMELSKKATLGLVLSYKNSKKILGFEIINQLKLKKRYNIKIKINKANHIKIYVDNNLTVDTLNDNLNYEISDIAVGTGFSKTRPFNGKIENFSIKYNYYRINPQLASKYKIFFLFSLFIIILGFINKLRLKKIKLSKPSFKKLLKFEYFPFLTACYPILFLISNNINKVVFSDFVQPLIISVCISFVLYFIFNIFFNYKKNAIVVFLILIYIYSAGHVFNFFKIFINPETFIYIFTIGFISLIFFLSIHKRKINHMILNFLKIMSIALVSISLINILLKIPSSGLLKKQVYNFQKIDQRSNTNIQSYPDIYYIILDAYANNWTLKKNFDYDNKQFLNYLKKVGFFVAEKSTSNYRSTNLSIPSSLNMNYIASLNNEISLRNSFENNEVLKLLKEKNYKFISINPDGAIISFNKNADINSNCNQFKEFSSILLQTTIFFNMSFLFNDISRQQILCGFDYASKYVSLKGPKFVYMHILSPHAPYLFTEFGGYNSKDGQSDIIEETNDNNKSLINKKGYLMQLKFINKKTLELVDKIINSKIPSIIIIQSDHGPDLYMDDSIKYGEKIPPDDLLKARMRNLSVFYLPNGQRKMIPDDITPVNIFRYIFNYYYDTNLKILDNYNYYSPDYKTFDFTDVTEKVKFNN